MNPLVPITPKTAIIVAEAALEQIQHGNLSSGADLATTAIMMYGYLTDDCPTPDKHYEISERIHKETQRLREEMVEEVIDKLTR